MTGDKETKFVVPHLKKENNKIIKINKSVFYDFGLSY
jgi:hypothetical protein